MNIDDFNAEIREARGRVAAGCLDLYMLMKQREAQHDEITAKMDRQHQEMMQVLRQIRTISYQGLEELA